MQIKKYIGWIIPIICFMLIIIPNTTVYATNASNLDKTNVIRIIGSDFHIEVDKFIFLIAIIFVIAIVISMILLYIHWKRKKTQVKKLTTENQKLMDDVAHLESTYQEVNDNFNQLQEKYSELQEYSEKNKKLAYTDLLTELPNRAAFTEMLDHVMLTLRKEETIGILYLDLDNFKIINDTLGNTYGDELLIDVTHRLKQVMDDNDYLARFGGDEFIILTQNIIDMSDYELKIKRIQKVLSYPFALSLKEFFITASIGICFAPKDGKTTQMLIKNVDSAMYLAKTIGKNTYCYFDDTMKDKLLSKIEFQSELKQAIGNDELLVYYQPQINLSTDNIVGFEALVRWNHPTRGVILPEEFILVAEETGLIVPIGRFVLTEACRQLKKWEAEGYDDILVSVNFSVRQFKDVHFIEMVKEVVKDTGIDANHLVLEITESIALEDCINSVSTMNELKEFGIQFSLDDFGSGYSSVYYLKELPLDFLKIDKSFLDSIMDNQNNQKIMKAIVTLSQTIDLKVVAEGVETNTQLTFLKSIHCDMAQGYLYSQPIPKEEAKSLLNNWSSFLE